MDLPGQLHWLILYAQLLPFFCIVPFQNTLHKVLSSPSIDDPWMVGAKFSAMVCISLDSLRQI
jgi:hypothetical protein